jgi:hypothetical protein
LDLPQPDSAVSVRLQAADGAGTASTLWREEARFCRPAGCHTIMRLPMAWANMIANMWTGDIDLRTDPGL